LCFKGVYLTCDTYTLSLVAKVWVLGQAHSVALSFCNAAPDLLSSEFWKHCSYFWFVVKTNVYLTKYTYAVNVFLFLKVLLMTSESNCLDM